MASICIRLLSHCLRADLADDSAIGEIHLPRLVPFCVQAISMSTTTASRKTAVMTQVHYTYDLNPKGSDAISNISAHAEYRREDYFFARNQSRTLRALEWEHREKPRSRTPRFVALAILMIVCGLSILSWQQGGIRTALAAADTHRPPVARSVDDLNLEADR